MFFFGMSGYVRRLVGKALDAMASYSPKYNRVQAKLDASNLRIETLRASHAQETQGLVSNYEGSIDGLCLGLYDLEKELGDRTVALDDLQEQYESLISVSEAQAARVVGLESALETAQSVATRILARDALRDPRLLAMIPGLSEEVARIAEDHYDVAQRIARENDSLAAQEDYVSGLEVELEGLFSALKKQAVITAPPGHHLEDAVGFLRNHLSAVSEIAGYLANGGEGKLFVIRGEQPYFLSSPNSLSPSLETAILAEISASERLAKSGEREFIIGRENKVHMNSIGKYALGVDVSPIKKGWLHALSDAMRRKENPGSEPAKETN